MIDINPGQKNSTGWGVRLGWGGLAAYLCQAASGAAFKNIQAFKAWSTTTIQTEPKLIKALRAWIYAIPISNKDKLNPTLMQIEF